ncbi:DUF5716 family protein [Anaerocolumna sp. MB42-C2]|uniref:DUF5716 family protein n=1 Tax=Anaerocolumna sp. MB42-C2 TaxID=3070997 RepID=UPI0027E1CB2B|nr:DUF5716 family protein [Anaerocolumna sp. MB42-C2]WMJ86322.1 DUF5716 family protein [Anaerocolumna sp. MB42-C2]
MSEQRSLIVGFDLCEQDSQICCYNTKTQEPESICVTSDKTKYLIPTVLGVKQRTKEWVYGEDAFHCKETGTGVLIDQLLKKVINQEDTDIYGVPFSPVALLEKYLRKCLQLIKINYPSNSIQKIVVTIKESTEILKEGIYKALDSMGIGKDRAFIQSHSQSYQFYALYQKKELWMNDVGLFDFDENGLVYKQLMIERKSLPYLVDIEEKNYQDVLNNQVAEDITDKDKLEYLFRNIANQALHKQIVSTIYITGKGFEGTWADKVFKELCIGRRVFKGQNLYVKGACFAALELAGEHNLDDIILLGDDMISSSFYLLGYYDTKQAEAVLAKAGTLWCEADDKIDLILDDLHELTIYRKDILKHETIPYTISLDGLPNRPNKTTRVEVRIKFLSNNTAIISVKDKGFGSFYPSSNRIWEKEIVY